MFVFSLNSFNGIIDAPVVRTSVIKRLVYWMIVVRVFVHLSAASRSPSTNKKPQPLNPRYSQMCLCSSVFLIIASAVNL